MNEDIETFVVDGLTVHIKPDPEPINPREEYDNFGHMICFHRRYTLGDKHTLSIEEAKALAARIEKRGGVVLPLFLYDHSGITMSTSSARFHACDSAGWDWGTVGFIYCDKDDIKKNWGGKRVTKKLLDQARLLLQSEVEAYDRYLRGEIYGYVVEDPEGRHLDSCWGFDGLEYCKEQATESAKAAAQEYGAAHNA